MKELKECLVCGNKDLKVYCDMGQMPLVNNLKDSPEEVEDIFLLLVNECPICTHKQLSITVDRELLFSDYLYKTGISNSHYEFIVDFVYDLNLKVGKCLDIGANDGTLLGFMKIAGWKVLGIDPSLFENENDVKIIKDFFPSKKIKGKFDCITAFNVFAHNDNPKEFLLEMAKLLAPEGRIYILTTLARLDNFYHEHISYFTPQSMMVLAENCGVEVIKFETVSMHGKSYLFEISHKKEEKKELNGTAYFEPMVAYGASASETVLFNYYKIKPEYVVDDNPLKQGKFIPGINSPIVPRGTLAKDKRDLTIIVAHNLFDEISEKIKKLRPKKKDKFMRLI